MLDLFRRPDKVNKACQELLPSMIGRAVANSIALPCTINREMALMKHAFSLAIKEWEWVREKPARKVSMEKEGASRDRRVAGEAKCFSWNGRTWTFSKER